MPTDAAKLSPRQIVELQRLLSQHEKKAKTSVSLSGELLRAIDILAGKSARSALVERALRRYLQQVVRRTRDRRDIAVIDAHAEATNRESDAVLDLQAWPE